MTGSLLSVSSCEALLVQRALSQPYVDFCVPVLLKAGAGWRAAIECLLQHT